MPSSGEITVISSEHAEEFTRGIGETIAGSWRLVNLARRMGVPQALGLTLEEWVDERLGGYVQLSDAEFHAAVLELRKEGLSHRQIASVTGVSRETVRTEEKGTRLKGDKNLPPPFSESRLEAESPVSNRDGDKNLPPPQPSLVDIPVISPAEAAIRELLLRFTYEELVAALEAVAP